MAGLETEGNVPGSYKEPGIAWMTGFLLAVSFVGILALVPLRKVPLLLLTTVLQYTIISSQSLA